MRNISLAGLFILFAYGLILFFSGGQVPVEAHSYQALYQVMNQTGAQIVHGEIHYWAELSPCSSLCSPEELEIKANDLFGLITGELGAGQGKKKEEYLPESHHEDEGNESFYRAVQREKTIAPGLHLRMVLQRMEQEGKNPLHLLVVIRETGEARQLESLVGKLLALLDSRTVKSSLAVSLTGHLDKIMALDEMEALAHQAARDSGGYQVQGVNDENMVSITGYLPELGEYLQAENMRINLNLALRYDDNVEKTVIRAGTPLIAGWY